jgi:hypothetical protein
VEEAVSGLVVVAIGICMMVVLAQLDLVTAIVGGVIVCAAGIVMTWLELE